MVTPHPQKIEFYKFPNPARHLLPNELYAEFPTERKNFTVMVTSLGCPHRCGFCEAGGTLYNARSPETVIAEVEECYHKYGIREIDIFDYQFTAVRERVLKICELLQEKKLDVTWACRSRIDTVDKKLLCEMKKSGCRRIYFGIESGSQNILDKVNKGIRKQQIRATIELCNNFDIKTLGFFLIGAPGDTRQTVKETLKFAKSLNLDYVQFSKCLAKPLTPLWEELVKTSGKDYWSDWVIGREVDRDIPRPWTQLSNAEINAIARWAYISYHIRLKFIMRHLLGLRSFSEFRRKLSAFKDMILSQENRPKADGNFKAFNENAKAFCRYKRG